VAANIVVTGVSLVRRSTGGLMDRALPADELARVHDVLERYARAGRVRFHALRTRRAGRRAFVSVHILVPGTVGGPARPRPCRAHRTRLREALGHATVFTHLEPLEDPVSFADTELDRAAEPAEAD
jgi:divalent metal cation (Fe/Co/Zn/Cd) transporter